MHSTTIQFGGSCRFVCDLTASLQLERWYRLEPADTDHSSYDQTGLYAPVRQITRYTASRTAGHHELLEKAGNASQENRGLDYITRHLLDMHLASSKGVSVATIRRDTIYAKTHEIQGH